MPRIRAFGSTYNSRWIFAAAALWLLPWLTGCHSEDPATPPPEDAARQAVPQRPPAPTPPPATPPPAETPVVSPAGRGFGLSAEDRAAHVVSPYVLMTADHEATCKVCVGDTFPDVPLVTMDDQPTLLSEQLGQRLTIVVFWTRQQPMSVEQIRRLHDEFAQRYRDAGVEVVTINVGDDAQEARSFLDEVPGSFAELRDPSGEALGAVATGLLPRTYLLTADRQVVWFDLEYSRSASRELRNAILYVLRQYEQQAANTGGPSLM